MYIRKKPLFQLSAVPKSCPKTFSFTIFCQALYTLVSTPCPLIPITVNSHPNSSMSYYKTYSILCFIYSMKKGEAICLWTISSTVIDISAATVHKLSYSFLLVKVWSSDENILEVIFVISDGFCINFLGSKKLLNLGELLEMGLNLEGSHLLNWNIIVTKTYLLNIVNLKNILS